MFKSLMLHLESFRLLLQMALKFWAPLLMNLKLRRLSHLMLLWSTLAKRTTKKLRVKIALRMMKMTNTKTMMKMKTMKTTMKMKTTKTMMKMRKTIIEKMITKMMKMRMTVDPNLQKC